MKTNRVRRLNIRDHSLTKLAEVAKEDVNYCRMIEHLKKGTNLSQIEEDCELRLLRGYIQHIGLFNTKAGPLIVRDSSTALIPGKARQAILEELHSTHLSVDYMKAMSRGCFFWPNIQEDLKRTFSQCQDCKRESSSKPTRAYNTTPPNLVLMAPAEEISCDFMSYGSQSILVIKDRQSGFIAAKLTKDKTTQAAIEALKTWFFNYGFASIVRSDEGPAFRDAFSQELDKLGVKHVLSSSFNPQSNGAAERVFRSLREVLEKRGGKKTTQLEISEICFKVNSISQPS